MDGRSRAHKKESNITYDREESIKIYVKLHWPELELYEHVIYMDPLVKGSCSICGNKSIGDPLERLVEKSFLVKNQ